MELGETIWVESRFLVILTRSLRTIERPKRIHDHVRQLLCIALREQFMAGEEGCLNQPSPKSPAPSTVIGASLPRAVTVSITVIRPWLIIRQ